MIKKTLGWAPLLLVSACSLFEPPLTRQDTLSLYRDQCIDTGFEWGTPEFEKCVEDLEYQEEMGALERRKAAVFEKRSPAKARNSSDLTPDTYFFLE